LLLLQLLLLLLTSKLADFGATSAWHVKFIASAVATISLPFICIRI